MGRMGRSQASCYSQGASRTRRRCPMDVRGGDSRGRRFPDVLVMGYSKAAYWADVLSGHMKTAVYDECQELRRFESNRYRACQHIARGAIFFPYGQQFLFVAVTKQIFKLTIKS